MSMQSLSLCRAFAVATGLGVMIVLGPIAGILTGVVLYLLAQQPATAWIVGLALIGVTSELAWLWKGTGVAAAAGAAVAAMMVFGGLFDLLQGKRG